MKIRPTKEPGGLAVATGPREAQLPPLPAQRAVGTLPVLKITRILVPVDFSPCSTKALEYAIPFARQFGSDLTLLYVVQPSPPMLEMAPVDVESLEVATEELERLQGTIPSVVRSSAVVRTGQPHTEIIEAARELGSDLIILSTHGRRGLERVLLGSTAEKVIRHAHCPVLVVREHEHEFIAAT